MNRRVPNGTHGGVEGGLITRPSDVGIVISYNATTLREDATRAERNMHLHARTGAQKCAS